MSKKIYINHTHKKGINHRRIAGTVLVIAVVITGGVGVYNYTLSQNIKKMQDLNSQTQKQIDEMKGSVEKLVEENEKATQDIEQLEQTLWRYEPVIIPESMPQ